MNKNKCLLFVADAKKKMTIDYPVLLCLSVFILSYLDLANIQDKRHLHNVTLEMLGVEERFTEFHHSLLNFYCNIYLFYKVMAFLYSFSLMTVHFPTTKAKKED